MGYACVTSLYQESKYLGITVENLLDTTPDGVLSPFFRKYEVSRQFLMTSAHYFNFSRESSVWQFGILMKSKIFPVKKYFFA
jgi:hypothetical protein